MVDTAASGVSSFAVQITRSVTSFCSLPSLNESNRPMLVPAGTGVDVANNGLDNRAFYTALILLAGKVHSKSLASRRWSFEILGQAG